MIVAATEDEAARIHNAKIRLIPKNKYSFASDLFIFGDIIAVISDTEEFAVRVESTDFADVAKEAFDLAWEEAGRLKFALREKPLTAQNRKPRTI